MQACALTGAMTPVARRQAGPIAPRRAQLRLTRIGIFRKQQRAAQRAVCVAALEASPSCACCGALSLHRYQRHMDRPCGHCVALRTAPGTCCCRQPPGQGPLTGLHTSQQLHDSACPTCSLHAEPLQV